MKVRCTYCKNVVDDYSHVCPSCGGSLSDAPPVSEERPYSPPPQQQKNKAILISVLSVFLLGFVVLQFLAGTVEIESNQPARDKMPAAGNRSVTQAKETLETDPANPEAYETVIQYSLRLEKQEEAYFYAVNFLENCYSLEYGSWCIQELKGAKREDLAVRLALLSDASKGTKELYALVKDEPLDVLFQEGAPLRQAMEKLKGKQASQITLEEIQDVTYLAVGGNQVLCGIGADGGPENALGFMVDKAVQGTDIGLVYFQGVRRLDCTDYPPLDILIGGLEELSIPHTSGYEDLTKFSGMKKLKKLTIGGKDFRSLEGLEQMKSLDSLTVYKSSIQDLSVLSTHTSIESLALLDNEKLESVASLAQMGGLKSLSVSGEAISDLSHLSALSALTALSVTDTLIKDTTFLSALVNLKELTFTDNDNVEKLPELEKLTSLEVLTLESDEMLAPEAAARLSSLRELKTRVSKKLTLIALMENLETLTIYSYIYELDISPLGSLSKLRNLSFKSGNEFHDSYTTLLSGLGALRGLPLETLDLRDKRFYGPIDSIFEIEALKELRLDGAFSQGTDYSKMAGLKNLEVLTLNGYRDMRDIPPGEYDEFWSFEAGPASAFTGSIGLLENLRTLTAAGCEIEDCSFVSTLKNLETLDLSDNGITDISPLEGLEKLRFISVSGNPIGDYSPVEGLDGVRVDR